jgi:uncharacterized membrane-anchored protein
MRRGAEAPHAATVPVCLDGTGITSLRRASKSRSIVVRQRIVLERPFKNTHGGFMGVVTTTLRRALVLGVVATLAASGRAGAQSSGQQIEWQVGPVVAKLGTVAELTVPAGYRFTGPDGAKRVMELTQNPASGKEVGILTPAGDSANAWFVIFTFRNTGYVKDDEKDKLDANKILQSISKGTESANDIRRKRGWEPVHVVGWARRPFYNPETNNLTWAIRGRSGDDQSSSDQEAINYSTRVLGRDGTMHVDLVASPEEFDATVDEFEGLMKEFRYVSGHRYSEWREGDPIAEYGLTALIVGGAGAVALKSGLLSKLWKVIVIGVAALLSAARRAIGALFGKKDGATANG